jgi:hypothetical protein
MNLVTGRIRSFIKSVVLRSLDAGTRDQAVPMSQLPLVAMNHMSTNAFRRMFNMARSGHDSGSKASGLIG